MINRIRRRVNLKATFLMVFLLGVSTAWAAPLEPLETYASAYIKGQAAMVPLNPAVPFRDAAYQAMASRRQFVSSSSFRLSDSVQIGDSPSFRPQASSESLAGASLEKVADNEYVLTLSSAAAASYRPDGSLPLSGAYLSSMSRVMSRVTFAILDPYLQKSPSTIHYRLEHFGTLRTVNNLRAMSRADLSLTAAGADNGLYYGSMLEIPLLPGGFEDVEFTGKRSYIAEGTISSYMGGMIKLTASLESEVGFPGGSVNPSIRAEAGSLFDSGLRLHMTVMPEPASALLMLAGLWIAGRKRR